MKETITILELSTTIKMSNYNFNAPINGSNHHFGDINNYATSQEFFAKNKKYDYSETERELVKIIFENTSSEEEKQQILNSLQSIKEEPQSLLKEKSHLEIITNYLEKLKKFGFSLAEKVIAAYLVEKTKNATF